MARYRYRYQTLSISSLGFGKIQVNSKGAWRMQVTANAGQVAWYIDGQTFVGDTADALNGEQVGFVQYTVGGVQVNGEPVMIEQNTTILTPRNSAAQGVIVLEWLDPIE